MGTEYRIFVRKSITFEEEVHRSQHKSVQYRTLQYSVGGPADFFVKTRSDTIGARPDPAVLRSLGPFCLELLTLLTIKILRPLFQRNVTVSRLQNVFSILLIFQSFLCCNQWIPNDTHGSLEWHPICRRTSSSDLPLALGPNGHPSHSAAQLRFLALSSKSSDI